MSEKLLLSIAGVTIISLMSAVSYFIIDKFKKADKMADKLTRINDAVTALIARQEGQLSFAKALMENQAETVLLRKEISKVHEELNKIYTYIRSYVDERINRHEDNNH